MRNTNHPSIKSFIRDAAPRWDRGGWRGGAIDHHTKTAPEEGAIKGQGEAVTYAIWKLEDRGPMLINPGDKIYQGMIIGEHSKENDLEVNLLEGKKLTNIRAAGKDEAVRLTPPILMPLEKAIAYIQDDELVEVTPKCIRLRKRHLDPNARKRASRQAESA